MSPAPRNRSTTRVLFLVVSTLVLVGCSTGSARHEVSTPLGYTLDCYTESIDSRAGQVMPGTVGADSAEHAIEVFQGDARPPGEPSIEAAATGKVVFVFNDEAGNRLGRLFVGETDQGWFVFQMERCDEES